MDAAYGQVTTLHPLLQVLHTTPYLFLAGAAVHAPQRSGCRHRLLHLAAAAAQLHPRNAADTSIAIIAACSSTGICTSCSARMRSSRSPPVIEKHDSKPPNNRGTGRCRACTLEAAAAGGAAPHPVVESPNSQLFASEPTAGGGGQGVTVQSCHGTARCMHGGVSIKLYLPHAFQGRRSSATRSRGALLYQRQLPRLSPQNAAPANAARGCNSETHVFDVRYSILAVHHAGLTLTANSIIFGIRPSRLGFMGSPVVVREN